MSPKIYLPGLNGLRAIAALTVVISHINNRISFLGLPNNPPWNMAGHAVTIFFALSGFLITYLLLKEQKISGTIDVKKFYMRRILRIWPLYYFYLLIAILVAGIACVNWSILFYFLMVPNLYGIFAVDKLGLALSLFIGPYWSLGVEEQFYAVWPWIIKKASKLLKYLYIVPFIFVLAKFCARISNAPDGLLFFLNYSRFGCLALGGYGAYLYFNHEEKVKQIFNRFFVELSAWIFFAIVLLNKFHITSIIDHEIITFFIFVIIINQISNPKRIISLDNKVFDYLGKISYGIYVYNPLAIYIAFMVFSNVPIENIILRTAGAYILSITVVISMAHFSYHYFEQYFLKLKSNYTIIQTSNMRDSL